MAKDLAGSGGITDIPADIPDRVLGRRLFLAAAAGLLFAPVAEAAAERLSLSARGGSTRLVVPLGRPVAWRVSAGTRPQRLIIHLPNLPWTGPARLAGAGVVREARRVGTGTNQTLVLTLTRAIAAPDVSAADGLLTVTMQAGPAPAFTRLANGRSLAAAPDRRRVALPLVVIDPGHGGRDPGAIGVRGTQEKRITLAAALELRRQLLAAGRCRVVLTRTRDVFIPLGARVEAARRREAALFLSLHADSAPGARGASVYTLSETASDSLAAALAKRENLADRAGGLRLPSVSPEVRPHPGQPDPARDQGRFGTCRQAGGRGAGGPGATAAEHPPPRRLRGAEGARRAGRAGRDGVSLPPAG